MIQFQKSRDPVGKDTTKFTINIAINHIQLAIKQDVLSDAFSAHYRARPFNMFEGESIEWWVISEDDNLEVIYSNFSTLFHQKVIPFFESFNERRL